MEVVRVALVLRIPHPVSPLASFPDARALHSLTRERVLRHTGFAWARHSFRVLAKHLGIPCISWRAVAL